MMTFCKMCVFFFTDLEDRDKSCLGGGCDKFPPDSKPSEINKLTRRPKPSPRKKNCRNSRDPSCARQDPRELKKVTKPRKPFRKPFTAFSSQRGPFRRPQVTTTTRSPLIFDSRRPQVTTTNTTRSPVVFDSNKSENDDEQTEKNMSDKDDEEDRRPKQLESKPPDNDYEKPDNNRKIKNRSKDNKIRNNNNRNKFYDENEEPTPEPEPSHHGNPRHHAFHSCKFVNIMIQWK